MSDEKLEIVRGGGKSLYHDFGDKDADAKLLKAKLAAEIIGVLDSRKLTVRAAADVVGITAADISRIRNADLGRFTIDRLVKVLNNLDRQVELTVSKVIHEAALA